MQDVPYTSQQPQQKNKAFNCFLYGFAVVGVLSTLFFLFILSFGAYIWIAGPLDIREIFYRDGEGEVEGERSIFTDQINSTYVGEEEIIIPPEYQQLMNAINISTDDILAQDPVVLETCVTTAIGADRSQELQEGIAQPELSDVIALKNCLN